MMASTAWIIAFVHLDVVLLELGAVHRAALDRDRGAADRGERGAVRHVFKAVRALHDVVLDHGRAGWGGP